MTRVYTKNYCTYEDGGGSEKIFYYFSSRFISPFRRRDFDALAAQSAYSSVKRIPLTITNWRKNLNDNLRWWRKKKRNKATYVLVRTTLVYTLYINSKQNVQGRGEFGGKSTEVWNSEKLVMSSYTRFDMFFYFKCNYEAGKIYFPRTRTLYWKVEKSGMLFTNTRMCRMYDVSDSYYVHKR